MLSTIHVLSVTLCLLQSSGTTFFRDTEASGPKKRLQVITICWSTWFFSCRHCYSDPYKRHWGGKWQLYKHHMRPDARSFSWLHSVWVSGCVLYSPRYHDSHLFSDNPSATQEGLLDQQTTSAFHLVNSVHSISAWHNARLLTRKGGHAKWLQEGQDFVLWHAYLQNVYDWEEVHANNNQRTKGIKSSGDCLFSFLVDVVPILHNKHKFSSVQLLQQGGFSKANGDICLDRICIFRSKPSCLYALQQNI